MFIRTSAILLSLCISYSSVASEPWTIEDVLDLAQTNYAQKTTNPELSKPRVNAYLLVSLSMSEASLMRLAQDAKDAGIPLVFQGVPNSVQKDTDGKVLPLLNPESLSAFKPLIEAGASVELNPELFTEYGIKKAPVLLMIEEADPTTEACGKTARALGVPGDVTLGYALDQITSREDTFGEAARTLRIKLGGRA